MDPLFYETFMKETKGRLIVNNGNLREWLAQSSKVPEHVRNHFFANLSVIEREAPPPVARYSHKTHKRLSSHLRKQ